MSGSRDHTVRVWDAVSGECVLGPLYGHTMPVYSVSFSPDGKRIVSGSGDNTVRVWDVSVMNEWDGLVDDVKSWKQAWDPCTDACSTSASKSCVVRGIPEDDEGKGK